MVSDQISESITKVIIAPIPISDFALSAEVHEKNVHSIAIVGRLHMERGVLEALDYAERILLADSNMLLFVVGEGDLRDEVNFWISSSKVKDQIRLLGALSHREVINLYSRIDFLISNAETEGYGLAVREALLNGCRVLMRRNEGSKDLYENFNKLVFEFDSVEEFLLQFERAKKLDVSVPDVARFRELQRKLDQEFRENLMASWSAD